MMFEDVLATVTHTIAQAARQEVTSAAVFAIAASTPPPILPVRINCRIGEILKASFCASGSSGASSSAQGAGTSAGSWCQRQERWNQRERRWNQRQGRWLQRWTSVGSAWALMTSVGYQRGDTRRRILQ